MVWFWGTGANWWAWGLGIFTTIIFWGLVIWAIAALIGWAGRGSPGPASRWRDAGPQPDNEAEQILAQRFAAGEIGAEEYHQRLNVLRSRQHPPETSHR
jgi:putative membrane protein